MFSAVVLQQQVTGLNLRVTQGPVSLCLYGFPPKTCEVA